MFLLKCKEPFLPLNSKTNALIGDINEGLVERVPLHSFSLAADEWQTLYPLLTAEA